MGKFSDYFRRKSDGAENNDGYEYYEDTHDENGEYTSRLRAFAKDGSFSENSGDSPRFSTFSPSTDSEEPSTAQRRTYQNFMVYEPKNADDVQTLIDFLKRRESAIINLDNVSEDISQRVLDFVSGAIYALNGSVHRVAGNIFLLSPEGVGITNSYEMKNNAKK